MKIRGTEQMSFAELEVEVARGAKIVVFSYTISVLILTFRRVSDPVLIRPGEPTFSRALPYVAISLLLGWWGFPFGLIFTPLSVYECLSGGKDVTRNTMAALWESNVGQPANMEQAGWPEAPQQARPAFEHMPPEGPTGKS